MFPHVLIVVEIASTLSFDECVEVEQAIDSVDGASRVGIVGARRQRVQRSVLSMISSKPLEFHHRH